MFRGALILLLAGLALNLGRAAEAPGEVYINRTSVQNQPVNHRHFINEGEFTVFDVIPWDGQSIETFTNRALMFGPPGFRFETVDPVFGFRSPARVFFNALNAEVQAQDIGIGVALATGFRPISASLIKVNALNVTNRGVLKTGASGYIQVYGDNVDLTGGALIIGDLFDPLSGGGFFSGFPSSTNEFDPPPGVYDLAWGIGGNTNANVGGVIGSVNPTDIGTLTPPPLATNDFGGVSAQGFRLDEALTWVREEVINESNEVVQVIAVQVSDPSIQVFASFIPDVFDFPFAFQVGDFLTAAIELQVPTIDLSTLARVTNSLYVLDQFGSWTNRALMTNILDTTMRPGNFVVHRGFVGQYNGQPATTNIREDIFTVHSAAAGTNVLTQDYLSTAVTNEWSIYPFEVASAASRLPQIPGMSLTNLGGQVELKAQQLNFINTRIRGEGYVSLTASNVVTLAGFSNVVDVPRLSIDFGTPNETLLVNEFYPDTVERFSGTARAYSSLWTNIYETYVTNTPTDPADTNIVIVTNPVTVQFQLTLLDARQLQTTEETVVQDLKLTSTNGSGVILFNEDLDVTNYIQIRANELVLSPGSRLAGSAGVHFAYTNLLNLSVISNFGTLAFSEIVDIRRNATQALSKFVNHGDISAYGVEIWADYFENTGTIGTFENIDIRASTLRIDSGAFGTFGYGDIRLSGDVLKISNWQAEAGGRLVLDAAQTITDSGPAASNLVEIASGFEVGARAPAGDLLGTSIRSTAGTFQFVDLIWGSAERGGTAAAFENNLALGELVLDGSVNSVFYFQPAHPNAAMYIDVLTIEGTQATSLAAITNALLLGMNVYYADVISTNPAITAQSLNRLFGPNAPFNLIWVPDFAGPNSAVDVALSASGPVGRMNRGLRESLLVDSDGDGIPNGRDAFPLSSAAAVERDVQLVGVNQNPAGVSFSIAGPQAVAYVIERTANLLSPNWQAVAGVLTSDPATSLKTFTDQIDQGSKQGYYRVRIAP